ncbi:MAG: MepB family protein [Flavobacterium sp.]
MSTTLLPDCLIDTKNLVFDSCNFEITNLLPEKESAEYSAYRFELNGLKVLFREAKTTPTKIGQFVTLWKRIGKGPIQPFDLSDDIDLFIINTRKDNVVGQFVFPKSVLLKQNVLTDDIKEGKRAIRVYPIWDKTVSKQAQKTQKWQLDYFLEMPLEVSINLERVKLLYTVEN